MEHNTYALVSRLWDVSSGREIAPLGGHRNDTRSGTFSHDGRLVATVSIDGTARLWLTNLQDTIREICTTLTRDLTSEERTQFGIVDQGPTCPIQ